MTVNYKLDAMYELRKFIWTKLQAAGIFESTDYYSDNIEETLIPIFPVQQSPEMSQYFSGKKHIVYDKIGIAYEDLWAICNEQILFTIYSTDVSEINEMRNFFIDEFRRMDESARDINRWSLVSNKFKFFSIYISEMSPTGPSEEIQGYMSADVILEVKYSRHTDSNGRFV
jgi:hypothetical protein